MPLVEPDGLQDEVHQHSQANANKMPVMKPRTAMMIQRWNQHRTECSLVLGHLMSFDQAHGLAKDSRVEQQNELETPGLFVNPLYQAVPDAYSHDNRPRRL